LGIGPSLTGLPEGVHLPAKAPSGLHLSADEFGLLGRDEPGLSASGHRPGQAVVRPVTLLGLLRTGAAGLAALDVALGEGPSTHGLWFSQLPGQSLNRPAIPYLVNTALYGFSFNIVGAAEDSLEALYPDGSKDFDKLEDMQKYFCNRARQEGFKVQCNLK
jgi:hypothetical protein